MLERLKRDFQLAVLTLFGASAVLGILPFAVYRFASGALWVGLADAVIVVAISTAVLHAWITGDTRKGGVFMVVCNTLGSLLITLLFGHHGLFWVFVVVVTNFFLTSRRFALIANAVLLLTVWSHPDSYISLHDRVSFMVTSTLVTIYTYIFAYVTATQRERMESLASQDALTGCANRRAMELELERSIAIHRRDRTAYSLAVLDLDHFKSINDRYGHEAGDQVLVDFVELLRQRTRKSDQLFRMGGEEFVLLMRDTNREQMDVVLTKLHRAVQESLGGIGGPVTVSIGGTQLRSGDGWADWLSRADAAMYRAKNEGRDRVVVDGGE
jgi:diguanylate cyclase (GGDEF)-like protein